MSAIAFSLLWKLWPAILAVGGALWWGWKQRRAGAASVRAEQAKAEQRANDIADEIQNDVRAMSPEQIDAELRKRAGK